MNFLIDSTEPVLSLIKEGVLSISWEISVCLIGLIKNIFEDTTGNAWIDIAYILKITKIWHCGNDSKIDICTL